MIENLVSVEASIECLTPSLFLLPFFVVEAFGKITWYQVYQVSANQHEEILCYSSYHGCDGSIYDSSKFTAIVSLSGTIPLLHLTRILLIGLIPQRRLRAD
jgi:hypothetical protein